MAIENASGSDIYGEPGTEELLLLLASLRPMVKGRTIMDVNPARGTMTDWVGHLEKSLQRCYGSKVEDELEALRDLRDVLDRAPPKVVRIFGRPLTRERFDKLAELDATETIARELSQPGLVGFLISGSRQGKYIATIVCSQSDEEFVGDGPTEALACSCALSRAVHRFASKGGDLKLKAVES